MRLAVILVVLIAPPAALHANTIETVAVGNAGNPADPQNAIPKGAVDYAFDLGKFEVTNAQYVAFLNGVDVAGANSRGLYNSQMSSDARGGIVFNNAAAAGSKYSVKAGRANNPVVFVSFFDAARFTNWLYNGQGNGDTEDGSYQLDGGTPIPSNADFVTRKTSASWCLPTLDEWYKAAFHKNDGVTDHYWLYPTTSNAAPGSDQPPGSDSPTPANSANFSFDDGLANGFNDGFAVTASPAMVASTNYLTDAGAYSLAQSPYGTFDQGGNVWEWNQNTPSLEARNVAGGSWINAPSFLASSASNSTLASNETNTIGFRVARVVPQAIPGDYNANGQVDAADYTIWRNTLGSTTDLRANGDNTGASMNVIDAADYAFWKSHFGEPAGTASATQSVPEPTPALLLLFGAILLLTTHRLRLRIGEPTRGVTSPLLPFAKPRVLGDNVSRHLRDIAPSSSLPKPSTKPSFTTESDSARSSRSSAPGSATARFFGPSSPASSPGSTLSTSRSPFCRRKRSRRSHGAESSAIGKLMIDPSRCTNHDASTGVMAPDNS